MARVTNIQSGRQSKALKFYGLPELQKNVNALKSKMAGAEAAAVAVDAGAALYNQALSNLQRVNAPHEVAQDMFIYGRQPSALLSATKSVTALVGLRKRGRSIKSQGYVEWYPGRQVGGFEKTSRTRRKRMRLVMPGTQSAKGSGAQKIGEHLGTMWELGTTKMAARPWWRPAVMSARAAIYAALAAGYRRILGSAA
jgi:hypothetical protein